MTQPPPPPPNTPEPAANPAAPAPAPAPGRANTGYAEGTFYGPGWDATTATETRKRGPARSVVGILTATILGAATIAVWVVSVWNPIPNLTGATKPLPADVREPQHAHARQLVKGNCIETAGNLTGRITDVHVVPCNQQHQARVISTTTFTGTWPGPVAITDNLTSACAPPPTDDPPTKRIIALAPSEDSWVQGDRTGLCIEVD